MGKQRGGSLRPFTYALLALVALIAVFALREPRTSPNLKARTEELQLGELYQFTPDDWNDSAYTVSPVPDGAQVCDSFVESSTCYITL